MNKQKNGSSGGKARAIIQKEEARKRIEEYNNNPNYCKYCGNPIYAPFDKKLRETKIKKFCSRSCSAKFNNFGKVKNITGKNNIKLKIDQFNDEELQDIFYNSKNLTDFSFKLGYSKRISINNKSVNTRLEELGLSLLELIDKKINILELSKKELFDRYNSWQTARGTIQKYAKKIYDNENDCRKCIVCGYEKTYEVAHVNAVSNFSDDALIKDINNKDNLIALCPNHHWEYDNNVLDIEKYLSESNKEYNILFSKKYKNII